MNLVTWTFVLVLNPGLTKGLSIVVPNFDSLATCQAYSKSVMQRMPSWVKNEKAVAIYDCVPSGNGGK